MQRLVIALSFFAGIVGGLLGSWINDCTIRETIKCRYLSADLVEVKGSVFACHGIVVGNGLSDDRWPCISLTGKGGGILMQITNDEPQISLRGLNGSFADWTPHK